MSLDGKIFFMLIISYSIYCLVTILIEKFKKQSYEKNNKESQMQNNYQKIIEENRVNESLNIYNDPDIKKLIEENQESYYDIKRDLEEKDFKEFENWTAILFRKLGYEANVSEKSKDGYDGGKDVIAKDKDGEITFIECKRWNNECDFEKYKVGREVCQKLVGTMMGEDGVRKGIVVTTGEIHDNATEYVKDLKKYHPEIDFQLWDLDKIINVYMDVHGLNTKNDINYMNELLE